MPRSVVGVAGGGFLKRRELDLLNASATWYEVTVNHIARHGKVVRECERVIELVCQGRNPVVPAALSVAGHAVGIAQRAVGRGKRSRGVVAGISVRVTTVVWCRVSSMALWRSGGVGEMEIDEHAQTEDVSQVRAIVL